MIIHIVSSLQAQGASIHCKDAIGGQGTPQAMIERGWLYKFFSREAERFFITRLQIGLSFILKCFGPFPRLLVLAFR